MPFFSQYIEFVSEDSRRARGLSPVTVESLDNRHEVSLPKWLVEDNTILDLGSCYGASGHWSLSNGCKHYTGVEIQDPMVTKSIEMLGKYWPSDRYDIISSDIRDFLDEQILSGKKYDVTIVVGVIYSFIDVYSILEKISKITKYAIVIDSIYPWSMTTPTVPIISIVSKQHINTAENNTAFAGVGARPSPEAMRIMMETLGFEDKEGLLYPKPLSDPEAHDTYISITRKPGSISYPTPTRYLMRFYKNSGNLRLALTDVITTNSNKHKIEMAKAPEIVSSGEWKFDQSVADRFENEAITHIPDYSRVLDLCLDYTTEIFKDDKTINIIDVGSALGNTMDLFIKNGYENVYGVENSPSMIEKSKYPDKVIQSSTFPVSNKYNVVLANWTLHFINNRKEYLTNIYESMEEFGLLILSDKMTYTADTENLYHKFKKANGVGDDIIQQKKYSLMGVLNPMPLEWYLSALRSIGFRDCQVINSKFMFSTIYARKF